MQRRLITMITPRSRKRNLSFTIKQLSIHGLAGHCGGWSSSFFADRLCYCHDYPLLMDVAVPNI
jgi:hypothetical protein